MAFILTSDRPENSPEEWEAGYKSYTDYLQSVKTQLPQAAYEYALADWHFNGQDSRSVHDSWLEEFVLREPSSGEHHEVRSLEIFVRLLGPYHDGHIELTYKNVRSYSISRPAEWRNHGDWLYDEIRLSDDGHVLHEIEWMDGRWLIECDDFVYEWLPFQK